MREGRSWSGHERNNCFANLGQGSFADVSFVSGLDFADDGRAVAVVDWDGDGDLDLWLRNRTGPQLRLLRNDHPGTGHFLALRLEGTDSNRDAIGATSCYEVNIYDQREDQTYRTGGIVNFAAPAVQIDAGGQWNTYEIRAEGTRLLVTLNGTVTVDIEDSTYSEGPFTLQYGSGVVKFRNVQIQRL